jgi:hypothetical protein
MAKMYGARVTDVESLLRLKRHSLRRSDNAHATSRAGSVSQAATPLKSR